MAFVNEDTWSEGLEKVSHMFWCHPETAKVISVTVLIAKHSMVLCAPSGADLCELEYALGGKYQVCSKA